MSIPFSFWLPLAGLVALGASTFMIPLPAPPTPDEEAEIGIAYVKTKNPEAEAVLRHVLERDPDQVRANLAIGMAETDAKHWDLAKANLERAAAGAPDDPDIQLSLVVLLQKSGHHREAAVRYKELIAKFPKDSRFVINLANLLLQSREYREAREYFKIYMGLVPKNSGPYRNAWKRVHAIDDELGDGPSVEPLPQFKQQKKNKR